MISTLKAFYQRLAVRRVFSRWADTYETDVAGNRYSAAKMVAQALTPYMKEGLCVTDLGIGTGLIWRDMDLPDDIEITGLDISAEMLEQLSDPAIGPLFLCDVGRDGWPVEDNSQHMVVSAGLFEYLDESMAVHVFNQAQRVLQPGGFFIGTYIPGNTNHARTWVGKSGTIHSYRFDPLWMEKQTGFKVINHTEAFPGSVFDDGSTYDYRLVIFRKTP